MLDLEFMRLAFGVGLVIGVLAPAVGFFLVERRQALIGDGLGHVAFAGVAAGYLLDVSPVAAALVFAVVGALAIEWLRSRGGTAGDQALALVFYVGIALGVVLVSLAGQLNVNLFQYLFGSILTTTRTDLVVVVVLGAAGLATIGALYRGLVGTVIDEEGSRVAGVRVDLLNGVVAVLAALTVALSMQIVGILLIAALMVLPVVASNRVAWSLASTLGLSIAIGVASVLGGLTILRAVARSAPARGIRRMPALGRSSPARRRRRGGARLRRRCSRPSPGCRLTVSRADGQDDAGPVPGAHDHVVRPGRAVHEVPARERALLALDDQQRLADEHEEVLLVGLPVVHRHRLAGLEHDQVDADLQEVRLAFEAAAAPVPRGDPARLAGVQDEPAFPPARSRPRSARAAPREPSGRSPKLCRLSRGYLNRRACSPPPTR